MKKLLPLLFIGAIGSANAQVIINSSDFPGQGTTFWLANDNLSPIPLGFDLGSASATAQNWDFSMLETDSLYEIEFYDPAPFDQNEDFPGADLALDQFGGYAFIEVGTSDVEIIGIAADFGVALGLPVPFEASVEAENPWKLFQFPASYGTAFLDTAVFDFRLDSDGLVPAQFASFWDPDSVRIKRTIYMDAAVDAEGTLTNVLEETHDVLRQTVVETNLDSIWGWTADDGWEPLDPTIAGIIGVGGLDMVYRTRFISKTMGYYVVDIETDGAAGAPLNATFLSGPSECCTSIEEVVASGQTVLYPNPTSDNIRIRTGGDIYQLNIMDMSGKLLQSEQLTIDGQTVELNGLANGLYVYQMLDEADKIAHTGRFSVIK
ncbi:MAG: hypothetical protein ACJAYA_000961 [Bacteroidia bacterium]|jgi:hypothetical protein